MIAKNTSLVKVAGNALAKNLDQVSNEASKHKVLESFLKVVGGEEKLGEIFAEHFQDMMANGKFMGKQNLVRQWYDSLAKSICDRNNFNKEQDERFSEKEQAELMNYISQNIVEFLRENPEIFRQVLLSNEDLLKLAAAKVGFELVPLESTGLIGS